MAFKVASQVRGLSDEAFRQAFGTEEQCRTALVRLSASLITVIHRNGESQKRHDIAYIRHPTFTENLVN